MKFTYLENLCSELSARRGAYQVKAPVLVSRVFRRGAPTGRHKPAQGETLGAAVTT
jgi:hypothetical protein